MNSENSAVSAFTDPSEGNSILFGCDDKKQVAPSLYWFFTLNNFTEIEFNSINSTVKEFCSEYRIQEEIGEQGTHHLQGAIKLKIRGRPIGIFKNKRIWFRKTKYHDKAVAYCRKEETATGNYILDSHPILSKIEEFDLDIPDKQWQLNIIDIVKNKADKRSINWYWESAGGAGKTCFSKYLVCMHDALYVSGKSADCKYSIVSYEKQFKKYPSIIIIDVPRTSLDYVNYEAIESIKNGLFFCTKYESCQVVMKCPHIFIFANELPNTSKLSLDRWNIIEIN